MSHQQELRVGDPIPNSSFVRDFCAECGEPIRIQPDQLAYRNYCDGCWGFPGGQTNIIDRAEVAKMLSAWRGAGLRDAALKMVALYHFGNAGQAMSMSEVAAKLGCSAQNVQQVVAVAEKRITAAGLKLPPRRVSEPPEHVAQLSVADGSNGYRKKHGKWKRD